MVIFILKGLGKNKDYLSLKKQFFPFGFHNKFEYQSQEGTGKLFFTKIKVEKKKELIIFFKENNIIYEEVAEETKRQDRQQKQTSKPKKVIQDIKNPSFDFYIDNGKNIDTFIWTDTYNELFKIKEADDSLKLTTIYPGLVVGSGYNHPVEKEDKEGYQLGFFFDHTTGLPLISGSSIKGVLNNIAKQHDIICNLYDKTIEEAKSFEKLFDDHKTIFYDAYIIDTQNNGKIFASDYITTHHPDDDLGEFKDPTPIKFLKILSEVTWQFQFKAEAKDIKLFKEIILDFGLGAKTNVGYGQFRE